VVEFQISPQAGLESAYIVVESTTKSVSKYAKNIISGIKEAFI
jgi:hypothetical protein